MTLAIVATRAGVGLEGGLATHAEEEAWYSDIGHGNEPRKKVY